MEDVLKSKLLLNPLDRAAEILFGLIMALTFTCSIGIATKGNAQIRELLIGAIGCNMAWGLVDATMYLMGILAQKSRSKTILDSVHDPSRADEAREYISESLPPALAPVVGTKDLEELR